MKKSIVYLISFIIVVTIISLNSIPKQHINSKPYEGKSLKIGVIGEPPQVREEQISFEKIDFMDLENKNVSVLFNAIFIMEENLEEASEAKYSFIYRESQIPFFFIESTKGHVPFIIEELSYEETDDSEDDMYATGIIYKDKKLEFLGYGLYNDVENDINISDIYTRIFRAIGYETRE